jgi:23S rRNA U2552 (ribose-2'-O)-methylase RlmE/FtsJ
MRDGHSIGSSLEAAAVVRSHAMAHCSLVASDLYRRLETIESADEAQRLALEFRAWAAREGLLLDRPKAIAVRPLPHR